LTHFISYNLSFLFNKTRIEKRLIFLKNNFNDNEISTCSPKYYEKKVETDNGNCINVQFWDTAGQEKYRAIADMIYKKADIIILTYAINDKKSFEEIQNYWYDEINYKSECKVIGLVGNKCDLYSQQQVDEIEARNYANSIKAVFGLTSALENPNSINNFIYKLIDIYCEKLDLSRNDNSASNQMISYSLSGNDSFVINKIKNQNQNQNDKMKKCC